MSLELSLKPKEGYLASLKTQKSFDNTIIKAQIHLQV